MNFEHSDEVVCLRADSDFEFGNPRLMLHRTPSLHRDRLHLGEVPGVWRRMVAV